MSTNPQEKYGKTEVRFELPSHTEMSYVAKCMSAYLMGADAIHGLQSVRLLDGSYADGPDWDASAHRWVLDRSNDYWLRVEGALCTLNCRHPGQYDTLLAMRRMFLVRIGEAAAVFRGNTIGDRTKFLEGLDFAVGRSSPPHAGGAFSVVRSENSASGRPWVECGDDLAELVDRAYTRIGPTRKG